MTPFLKGSCSSDLLAKITVSIQDTGKQLDLWQPPCAYVGANRCIRGVHLLFQVYTVMAQLGLGFPVKSLFCLKWIWLKRNKTVAL